MSILKNFALYFSLSSGACNDGNQSEPTGFDVCYKAVASDGGNARPVRENLPALACHFPVDYIIAGTEREIAAIELTFASCDDETQQISNASDNHSGEDAGPSIVLTPPSASSATVREILDPLLVEADRVRGW